MSSHVLPVRLYLAVFAVLIALTVVTVWAAFIDLGHIHPLLNVALALAIAATKATLVILYFMHVRYGTRLTTLVAVSGFAWLAILLLFTASDYVSRDWLG